MTRDAGSNGKEPLELIAEDCEFLEARRTDSRCAADEARCLQAQSEQGVERLYVLTLSEEEEDGADESLSERVECVERWLAALGLAPEADVGDDSADIHVIGTFGRMGAVIESRAISSVEFSCADEACSYCTDLDREECEEDAFCHAEMGRQEQQDCLGPWTFAVCHSGDFGCDGSEGAAQARDGSCWYFPSLCYAEGFDYSSAQCSHVIKLPLCEE